LQHITPLPEQHTNLAPPNFLLSQQSSQHGWQQAPSGEFVFDSNSGVVPQSGEHTSFDDELGVFQSDYLPETEPLPSPFYPSSYHSGTKRPMDSMLFSSDTGQPPNKAARFI